MKFIFGGVFLCSNLKEFLLCLESTTEMIVSLPNRESFGKFDATSRANNMSLEGGCVLLKRISIVRKAVISVVNCHDLRD